MDGGDDGGVRLQQQAELGRRDAELGDAGVLLRAAPGGGRQGGWSRVSLENLVRPPSQAQQPHTF